MQQTRVLSLACNSLFSLVDDKYTTALDRYPEHVYDHIGAGAVSRDSAKVELYQVSINNACDHHTTYVLNTAITHANLLRIVTVSNGAITTLLDVSAASKFVERPINSRVLVVPLSFAAKQTHTLYVAYEPIANYPLFLAIYQDSYRQGLKSFFDMANGVFFGAILVLILFFFLQFLLKPSRALAYYCLLVLSVGLFVGQITGYWFQFLWPNHGLFNVRFSSVAGGLTYLWYFLFTSALFDLRKHHPLLHRLTLLVSTALALVIVLGLFVDVSSLIAIFAVVALPLPVIIGFWALKNKMPSALIFVFGSLFHCTFTYIFILSVMGWDIGLHKSVFGLVGLGQLIDICLFAGALIYQSKVVRDELNDVLIQKLADAQALAKLEKEKVQSMSKLQDNILQLAATTHDLTQPLASIKMALAVVDDKQSKAAKEKMQTALTYTEKLLRSVIESAQADYFSSEERIMVNEVLHTLRDRHLATAKEKGLTLSVAHHGQSLRGSAVVISRILDNLVSNALRYTQKGGVLVCARSKKDGVLLQVWDTGSGMPAEVIAKLNQPFKHQGKDAASVVQGHGLGIYIVQSLCANAGFLFRMRAKPGRGSCCSIFIPNERYCEFDA